MIKQLIYAIITIIYVQVTIHAQSNAQTMDSTNYTLGFSTYLSHVDKYASGFDIYSDDEGYTYIAGNTKDKNFPVTEGAYQKELKGEADAFVVKFTPKGEIVFATLIGGSKREHHVGLTVDEQGFIYLSGGTHSSDYPVTEGAYDTSFNGEGEWAGDVFLTKMDSTGSNIIFSTFIGGEVEETVSNGSINFDSKGNIILVGITLSHDFPITHGVIEKGNRNMNHGFVSKLSSNGEELLFSTCFGNSPLEMILGLDVDDKDNIYVTGCTLTKDLPVTDNALRKEIIMPTVQGRIDHFIAKINGSDGETSYLSYFGAEGYMATYLQWAKPNKLIVFGTTADEDFPITNNAISKETNGERNCFISVFNSDDMTLEYSTLFGGSGEEKLMSAHVLNKDTVVIGGTTSSADYPLTENALYKEYPSCEKTFNDNFFARKKSFVSVIDIKNGEVLFSSYLGSAFLFNTYPDQLGNISFVAETGQRAEAGITGFPVSENAIMEPPTYAMVGRLVKNDLTKQTK